MNVGVTSKPRSEAPSEILRRYEAAIERISRPRPNWLEGRWIAMLCDCGRTLGVGGRERCPDCHTWPAHSVELRLTQHSALHYALTRGR